MNHPTNDIHIHLGPDAPACPVPAARPRASARASLASPDRRLALAALGAAALAGCAVRGGTSGGAGFDLQAHRGGRALAPENTLAAFDNAIDIGVTTLELDIGLSADGVVVISHDTVLNPAHTRDASGAFLRGNGPALRALPLAQLQGYDVGRIDPASDYGRQFPAQVPRDGERIPTLGALFERVRERGADAVRFNIETKLDPARPAETASPELMVRALLASIDRAGMASRVTLQSFDWRTLALAAELAPQLPRAYLSSARTLREGRWTAGLRTQDFATTPRLVRAAAGAGAVRSTWSPAFSDLSRLQVVEAHDLGLRVVPWTVNQPADMARLIDWSVDGLITDDPVLLRRVMQERGMALPAPGGR